MIRCILMLFVLFGLVVPGCAVLCQLEENLRQDFDARQDQLAGQNPATGAGPKSYRREAARARDLNHPAVRHAMRLFDVAALKDLDDTEFATPFGTVLVTRDRGELTLRFRLKDADARGGR